MEQTDNTVGLSCDLIIHPGESLAEALEERNMTQSELAIRTGMSELYIEQVIKGQQDITPEFASKLEGTFGIESLFWRIMIESLTNIIKVISMTTDGWPSIWRKIIDTI